MVKGSEEYFTILMLIHYFYLWLLYRPLRYPTYTEFCLTSVPFKKKSFCFKIFLQSRHWTSNRYRTHSEALFPREIYIPCRQCCRSGSGSISTMYEFARNDDNGVRTRRAAATHGLVVQFARTDIRKYSLAVRVVEPWNRLPDTLKKAASKEAFKREWKLLRK